MNVYGKIVIFILFVVFVALFADLIYKPMISWRNGTYSADHVGVSLKTKAVVPDAESAVRLASMYYATTSESNIPYELDEESLIIFVRELNISPKSIVDVPRRVFFQPEKNVYYICFGSQDWHTYKYTIGGSYKIRIDATTGCISAGYSGE